MDNLERRVIRLEEQLRAERELIDWRFADVYRRLQERSSPKIPLGSPSKIALAIALPLLVLLGTGDLRKVVQAIRLLVGG
jgi:hypothetical protein